MTENKKGVIAEVLDYLKENPFIEGVSDYEIFERQRIQAHANLQAFVDEAKNYEKDYGVSQYNFREFVEIVTEALRGIE